MASVRPGQIQFNTNEHTPRKRHVVTAHKHTRSPPASSPLQITGIYKRLGCPLVYPMFRKDPRVARLWLEQVLSWDVDKILASHLDPWVSNGKEEIRRCFGFVLE